MEQGPCLSHCYTCSTKTVVAAHLALVYVIACFTYIVMTRCLGTPFMDSVTEEQKMLKNESATKRSKIFVGGLIVGFLTVHFIDPFHVKK